MALMFTTPNGQAVSYNTIEEIGPAYFERGERPTRQDGTLMDVVELPDNSGLLFDGYPINVILLGVWYPGQQDALVSLGYTIPPEALTLPIVAQPAPGAGGMDFKTLAIVGGAAYLAYNYFSKR